MRGLKLPLFPLPSLSPSPRQSPGGGRRIPLPFLRRGPPGPPAASAAPFVDSYHMKMAAGRQDTAPPTLGWRGAGSLVKLG
jgi:hypothetical protein